MMNEEVYSVNCACKPNSLYFPISTGKYRLGYHSFSTSVPLKLSLVIFWKSGLMPLFQPGFF